jgi:ribose transport system permease protein
VSIFLSRYSRLDLIRISASSRKDNIGHLLFPRFVLLSTLQGSKMSAPTTTFSVYRELALRLPRTKRDRINAATVLACTLVAVALCVRVEGFMRWDNILDILSQLSVLGFMAIGMTYVMVVGGIDLSMYTVVSAAAVVGATMMVAGYSPSVGCCAMLAVAVCFGVVNGVAVAFLRMVPFIVTLSTMVLAQGFAVWFTKAQSISDLPDGFTNAISGEIVAGISVPTIMILTCAGIAGFVLAKTKYGRWLYLIGENRATAEVSGIPVRAVICSTYIIASIMAGITAVVITASLGTATTAMLRDDRLLDVVATTVIGGAGLSGGSGSVLGTMLGLLFIVVLGNAFNLMGLSPFVATILKGAVLVLIIGVDAARN